MLQQLYNDMVVIYCNVLFNGHSVLSVVGVLLYEPHIFLISKINTYARYLNAVKESSKRILKAEFGDGLHLNCKSYGPVKWYFKKFKWYPDFFEISSKSHIYVYPIQKYTEGIFYCYGYNRRLQTFLAEYELIVYGKY